MGAFMINIGKNLNTSYFSKHLAVALRKVSSGKLVWRAVVNTTEILFLHVTLHYLVRLIQKGLEDNFNPNTAKYIYKTAKNCPTNSCCSDDTFGFPLLTRDVCS